MEKVSACREMIHRGELTDTETPSHRPSLSSGSLDVGPWTFELRMARNYWRDVNLAASTLILKHSHYDHIMITLYDHYV